MWLDGEDFGDFYYRESGINAKMLWLIGRWSHSWRRLLLRRRLLIGAVAASFPGALMTISPDYRKTRWYCVLRRDASPLDMADNTGIF